MGDPFAVSVLDTMSGEIDFCMLGGGSIVSFGSSFMALNAKKANMIEIDAIPAPIAKEGP